jgi:hypothetical protein
VSSTFCLNYPLFTISRFLGNRGSLIYENKEMCWTDRREPQRYRHYILNVIDISLVVSDMEPADRLPDPPLPLCVQIIHGE